MPPEPSASIESSASRHGSLPGRVSSKFDRLAETLAWDAAVAATRARSTRPRDVPASFTPSSSSTSPASATSLSKSSVHCTVDDSAVPKADTSTAGEEIRASSIRSRSPRVAPRRPRSQAVNGSFHRSNRSSRLPPSRGPPPAPGASCCVVTTLCTAATSRELARTSSTRLLPSARATAVICNCPPVTRTSGRTVRPPGMARAAAARSTSTATAKFSPASASAQSHVPPAGRRIRPEASALNS